MGLTGTLGSPLTLPSVGHSTLSSKFEGPLTRSGLMKFGPRLEFSRAFPVRGRFWRLGIGESGAAAGDNVTCFFLIA